VTPDLAQLAGGPLVAAPVSVSSPFDGLWLVQDGMSLANGISNGDWVEGGMAAFSLLMDGAAALIDPIGTLIGMGLSWVLEHIWPLNEYLNALTGNAGEVLRMSQTWANISTHLSGAGADLDRFLGDLESLQGAAIEAYRKFQSDVAEHIALAGNLAAATSAALELASTIVKIVHDLTRDVISQIAGTAISAAITTAATVGFGAPVAIAQVAARVSALVPKVTRAITSVIRSFEKLAPLLAKVDEIFEALKRVLNRILRGGDTPTTPHTGGDTPTTPHPGGDTPTTPPAGGDPPTTPPGGGGSPTTNGGAGPTTTPDADVPTSRPDTDLPTVHVDDPPTLPRDQTPRPDAGDGQVHADHGTSGDYPPTASPDPRVQQTLDLVSDPQAPYGRFDDGTPLTQADYDARFVNPDGTNRYPSNDGAVPGSRVDFTDPQDYFDANGMRVDRIGDPRGSFMAVMEDGVPSSFESRALPVDSLGKPYTSGEFVPDAGARMADEGIVIQTSEVAHAFGQDGGATQVLFFRPDETGSLVEMSMQDLIDEGYFL
jgi:hypothetical protein